jgi:rhodanese-related sulfurtransferase
MAALREAWVLLVIAVGLAVVSWAIRGDRLPLLADPDIYALDLPVPLVSVAEARELYDAGTHYFVDTRADGPLADGAIPGSFLIRETTFDTDIDDVLDFLYPEDPLILYGASLPLPVAAVAVRLQARGYENLVILQGGYEAWRQAGGPVTDGEAGP